MAKAERAPTVGSRGAPVKAKQARGRPCGPARGQRRNTYSARTSKLRGNTAVTGSVRVVGINDRDPPSYLLRKTFKSSPQRRST
jgi:hypothetical protein